MTQQIVFVTGSELLFETVSKVLIKMGFSAKRFSSDTIPVDIVPLTQCSLIIVDYYGLSETMLSFFQTHKTYLASQKIPIFGVISSMRHEEAQNTQDLRQTFLDAYLFMPFSPPELSQAIHHLMEQTS